MTDNRTTELLREGLAERGIEWRSGLEGVTFVGDWCFVEYDNGRLAATCEPVLTPEQAIAATLGDEWDGKPFVEYVEHVAKEIHGEAFALLEGCDEPDFSAIDAICAACEDVVTIAGRWKRGESQDEAATLGGGNADADDALALLDEIREAGRISYDDYSQLFDAIAAWNTRHVETCEVESSFLNDFSSDHECWFEFDLSCGHHITGDVMEPPNYCEVCGAKIQGVDNAD